MEQISQNKISKEMGSWEFEERLGFAIALYNSRLKVIDKKTIENLILGKFKATKKDGKEKFAREKLLEKKIVKERINDGVKNGILSKSGTKWKINRKAIEEKYRLLMTPGLCR